MLGGVFIRNPIRMKLPLPTPDHVAKFKVLYRQEFGIEINDEEAYDQCSRLFRYIFLTRYALPYLRTTKEALSVEGNDPVPNEESSDQN